MNISSEGKGGRRSRSMDFDLNLAPIVDCFTVLITFMLVSASFLSIGILDAGVGASGESAASQTPPVEIVQVEMQPQFTLEIKLSGQATETIHLGAQNGNWDFDGLTGKLKEVKSRWPQLDFLVLSATNDIEYIHIIKCMEMARKVLPAVVMGGF